MTIVDSRLKDGTLILNPGGVAPAPVEMDISCQLTNVRLTAAYSDDGDSVETLCGDKIAAGEKADGYTLAGTFIQDWTATPESESIIWYLWDHNLEEVPFEYTPNPAGPTLSGTLRLKLPGEFLGGDVNTRLTSDFEWTVTVEPTRTAPTAALAGAGTSSSSSSGTAS